MPKPFVNLTGNGCHMHVSPCRIARPDRPRIKDRDFGADMIVETLVDQVDYSGFVLTCYAEDFGVLGS
jgi:hypothetical protein